MFSAQSVSESFFACSAKDTQPRFWYAAYTRSRHEKKVAQHLLQKSVACFLPLYDEVHQWTSGKANVQLPLFPGYVFVNIHPTDFIRVLQTPGVVRFVKTHGSPTPIRDAELESVRTVATSDVRAEMHPFLAFGTRVQITRGPLRGIEGIIVSQKGSSRLILSITLIMRSVSVEVAADDFQPIEAVTSCVRRSGFFQVSPAISNAPN
jgi:transcription elongation factor/antiterminator RfaH